MISEQSSLCQSEGKSQKINERKEIRLRRLNFIIKQRDLNIFNCRGHKLSPICTIYRDEVKYLWNSWYQDLLQSWNIQSVNPSRTNDLKRGIGKVIKLWKVIKLYLKKNKIRLFKEFQGWWTFISPIGYKLVKTNSGKKMLMFCKVTKQTVCDLRLHGCTKKTSKERGFNR